MENDVKYIDTDSIYESHLQFLSDSKLRTEDRCVFNVHKFELAKNSVYFKALFCGKGKDRDDILIPGVRGDVLSKIISFIYTGNVTVNDESISDVMIAADYLLLDDLLSSLKIYLEKNSSVENCLSFYIAALKTNRPDIVRQCYRFVQTHFESVLLCNYKGFEELSAESLGHFLCDRSLCVSDEKSVYLAIARWVRADKFNRQQFVPDLLMCLSAGNLDEQLAFTILEDDLVVDNPFCQRIIDAKRYVQHAGNLNVLLSCLQGPSESTSPYFSQRKPSELNCIARFSARDGKHMAEFYVTYDENIDLWRKILGVEFSPQIVICAGDYIYLLSRGDYINFRYSITKKELSEMNGFTFPRYKEYAAVIAGGKLHVLGGVSNTTGDEIDVEVYNDYYDFWYPTTEMIQVNSFGAVALGKSIYVVGMRFGFDGGHEMVAQVYDANSETWDLLPTVSVERSHFAMVTYLGRVYVIGGMLDGKLLTDVEVLDPVQEEWTKEPSLPHAFNVPKAIVLRDLLVVYDNHGEDRDYMRTYPPVFWDSEKESWELFEDASEMNRLHLYQFLTVDNSEMVVAVTIENRDIGRRFEKSPFV